MLVGRRVLSAVPFKTYRGVVRLGPACILKAQLGKFCRLLYLTYLFMTQTLFGLLICTCSSHSDHRRRNQSSFRERERERDRGSDESAGESSQFRFQNGLVALPLATRRSQTPQGLAEMKLL